MNKRIFASFLLPLMLAAAIPAGAAAPNFRYRSTVFGESVRNAGGAVNEIVREKYAFGTGESLFFLSRIFAIENVDSFQFRHDFHSGNGQLIRQVYSSVFTPRRHWWAETYYWNGIEPLPAGSYTVKVYVSKDGGAFNQHDAKQITVGSGFYDCPDYPAYRDYYSNVAPYSPNYSYSWSKTGTSVTNSGGYNYVIGGEKSAFSPYESVKVLSRFYNINGVDRFRVKYELYLDGNRFQWLSEYPEQYPRNSVWPENYAWSDFGSLPKGYHEIRVSMSLNGGAYRLIDTKHISVGDGGSSRPEYVYGWTRTNNNIRQVGGHTYQMDNERQIFTVEDNVVALTSISNISGIDSFAIRHSLYKRGTDEIVKRVDAPRQFPHGAFWPYSHNWTDFTKMPAGEYELKTYIQIGDSLFEQLETKLISVVDPRQGGGIPSYTFDWTRTGTGIR